MAGIWQSSRVDDTASSTASPSPPKNVASMEVMEPKAKPHPRTSEMVMEAIKEIGERGGSSLFAIKKYIALVYKLDTNKQANLIKKYLKAAVISGKLVQTKGKGASGSFKLSSAKTQAVGRKATKLVETKVALAKVPPAKKALDRKSFKTESAKSFSSTKKLASSKLMKKESSATLKNAKTPKAALPKSPKAKKLESSPTTKPKATKQKQVGAGA